jgi:rare lipoprotein A
MLLLRTKWILMGLAGAAAALPLDLAEAQQVGHASWYALYSRTASGEMMNPGALTAAHRSLPFGTKVRVENLSNGRSVVVRINDRGPFVGGRVIDLSKAAAAHIGMVSSGTAKVKISATGSTATASTDAADKVASGKELAAKAAASEPSDERSEPSAKMVEAAVARPASKKSASRKASATKDVASRPRARSTSVASRTRTNGTRIAAKTLASKTRATRRTGSAYTRVASAQKSARARSASKRRNIAVARVSPCSGFAPSALLAG